MKICSHDASCIICRLCASNYAGSFTERLWTTVFPKRGPVRTHTFSYCFPVKASIEEARANPFTPGLSSPGPEGVSEGPISQVTAEGSRASAQAQQLGHRGRCSALPEWQTQGRMAPGRSQSDTWSRGWALMESIKRWNLWPGLSHGKHWHRHVKGVWKNISQATEEKGPGADGTEKRNCFSCDRSSRYGGRKSNYS